ncbi:hypothetical protein MTR_1g029510 [Medicago truncatula]|uniref:Uncharacterized protein n=1 Tax=Medicago truncatula TaxID=3880 RepID=A0A072VFW0_MEDTR|nr:hypothetical protein MTR_1g029510 [Medicago truncatula]
MALPHCLFILLKRGLKKTPSKFKYCPSLTHNLKSFYFDFPFTSEMLILPIWKQLCHKKLLNDLYNPFY